MNYQVLICVGITSNTLRPVVSIFDTGAGQNLVRTPFLLLKFRCCIHPIPTILLKSSLDSLVHIMGQVMMFVHLQDLQVRVYFAVVESFAMPLLLAAWAIDRFVKGMFPVRLQIGPIRSYSIAILLEYTQLSYWWVYYGPHRTLRVVRTTSLATMTGRPWSEPTYASKFRLIQKHLCQQQPAAMDSYIWHTTIVPCANEWHCGTQGK